MPSRFPLLAALVASLGCAPLHAVIFDATGDPSFNTTAPGGALAGSGWQYQGEWGLFLGTPIAPEYFITAAHLGLGVGEVFRFAGHSYLTDASFKDPMTDLQIWHVTEAFPFFATLYTEASEVGRDLVVIGRGTQRGDEIRVNPGNVLVGWEPSVFDSVQRWGTNTVSRLAEGGTLLAAEFNDIGGTEAHLSTGDSGGGVFIQDPVDHMWKLAGINYGVSGEYYTSSFGENPFNAALFDQTGHYLATDTDPIEFVPASGPGEFFATRISSRLAFIQSVIPEPGSALLLLLGTGSLAGLRGRRAA